MYIRINYIYLELETDLIPEDLLSWSLRDQSLDVGIRALMHLVSLTFDSQGVASMAFVPIAMGIAAVVIVMIMLQLFLFLFFLLLLRR